MAPGNIFFWISRVLGVLPWDDTGLSKWWLSYSLTVHGFIFVPVAKTMIAHAYGGVKYNTVEGLYYGAIMVVSCSFYAIPLLHGLRVTHVFYRWPKEILKAVRLTNVTLKTTVFHVLTRSSINILMTFYWAVWVTNEFLMPITFTTVQLCTYLIIAQFILTVQQYSEKMRSCRDAIHRQPQAACAYSRDIAKFVRELTEFYSPQILLFITTGTSYSVLCLRSWFYDASSRSLALTVFMVDNLITIAQIVRCCKQFELRVNEFYEKLFRALRQNDELFLNTEMVLYLKTKPTTNFTAWGFFSLGYPLFTSIIATVTTYLLIVVPYGEDPLFN